MRQLDMAASCGSWWPYQRPGGERRLSDIENGTGEPATIVEIEP